MLYQHARVWAPGFDVPHHIPQVRIGALHEAAGTFGIDRDGWTTISVARETFQSSNAVWLTLAHEICHHILEQSGLADRRSTTRNERMTDIAMFICGFGELVMNGHSVIKRTASGSTHTHFGYLDSSEYSYAYHWVISARTKNKLSGMNGVSVLHPSLAEGFSVASELDILMRRLRELLPDEGVRERLIRHHRLRYPSRTEVEIIQDVIDGYLADRR
jgi:hypothetical protein